MTQVIPRRPEGFGFAYPAEEGGVWWERLTGEQWERLVPYEGQCLPVDEILAIAGGRRVQKEGRR